VTLIPTLASNYRLLALVALVGLGANEQDPAPKLAGTPLPDPPRQHEPWTPPETKLPRFLISATAALFEHGMADPRGCEYRDVELSEGQIKKTRGFVLPERAGQAGRFVVGWDGLVYRAKTVGAAADLDKDVCALALSMHRDRQSAVAKNAGRAGNAGAFNLVGSYGGLRGGGGPPSVDVRSPLKICLLVRLGRADLAEVLFAAGTNWTPEARGRDLSSSHINYLTLATDWTTQVVFRLLNAHARGDDAIALDAARRLTAFVKAAETKADAMGFVRSHLRFGDDHPSYFPFLHQLPELLADQERRASEPARGPIPKRGDDPKARIAALIRDLDQTDEPHTWWPGGVRPGGSLLVRALITEGDPAVEPLLSALETDMRLTRSVSFGRRGSIDRIVVPVYEAALSALAGILQTNEFRDSLALLGEGGLEPRKQLARSIRDYWAKNRTISLAERWYRTLRDDAAGLDRWLEAAREIVKDSESAGLLDIVGLNATARPPQPAPPMKGEELRSRRDPSVSDLLARRIAEIARAGNPLSHPNIELHRACELALILDHWDSKASLPSVRALMGQCREDIALRREQGPQPDEGLSRFVSQFALIRARAGGREGLGDYCLWLRKSSPDELTHQGLACFEPMWTYPDDPAIAVTARWLWNDSQSPWIRVLRDPQSRDMSMFFDGPIDSSPLLRVAAFRDSLLAGLTEMSQLGTVTRSARGSFQYRFTDGGNGGMSTFKADLEDVELGVNLPFRVCDYLAWQVSSIEGAPEIELYWPEDRRDEAVESCAAFLKRYGDRFTAVSPDGERDFPGKRAHLAFPPLGRPATLDDVRKARAIFSLEGQGHTRLAKVPELPIKARWVTLKDSPYDRPHSDGTIRRDYDQDGWIWQAEEVRNGDGWERSYGFVGRHKVARVPASEIELRGERSRYVWGPLPGGLDARLEPVESSKDGYQPGRPILVALRFRNRRGVEQAAPTEFLRQGEAGRPALRRGVTLEVFYSSLGVSRSSRRQGGPAEELKPKRTDRFAPGDATRLLPAFDGFEATRLDLTGWFDLTRSGAYRVRVKFAADSGVAEGASNEWRFMVGNPEDSIP